MNSYQTANAAFHAAGLRASEGVKHGRGYHFRRAMTARSARELAAMLGVEYPIKPPNRHVVGRWNDEDKKRQLALAPVGRYPAGDPELKEYSKRDAEAIQELYDWAKAEAAKYPMAAYTGKRADVMIADDWHRVEREAYDESMGAYFHADGSPRVEDGSVHRTSAVGAAAAGGTSWPRYSVMRGNYESRKWDVIDREGRVHATFGNWHWANITAKAWSNGESVATYGRRNAVDVSEFTTA